MSNKINVAVIGCGERSRYVVGQLLKDSDRNVKIAAVYDPDKSQCEKCLKDWDVEGVLVAESFEDSVVADGVTWTMVFSPNSLHREHILYAFNTGKHVFAEKPLAITIDDCREIYEAHQKSGLIFATGFVLRYAPVYRKAKEILDSGRIGKIISIDANENITPGHGAYIMKNWRRNKELAGPHILEKCCHDLDLINWFCGSLPGRTASFGGLDFFIPENEHLRQKYGEEKFDILRDPHAVNSPFTSDKNLMDNQVSILEYRNNVRVQFQATMSNPIPERRMYFSCTEGTLRLELYSGLLEYKSLGDNDTTKLELPGGGHGGGDSYIMKELYDTMTNGTPPACGGNEGLESAVVALSLDKAAEIGRIIDLEPVWKSLGR